MFGTNYSNPYLNSYGFNPTQPYGYSNPYYNQLQQQAQNQTQPVQPQPQPQQQVQPQQPPVATNTNKIYVNGIEDVRNRILPPNSDMFFVDNDKPLVYQKVVDSKGQFEVKTFEIRDYKPVEEQKVAETTNLSDYVLKTDLEPLEREIKALNDRLTKFDVQKQIDSIKKETKSTPEEKK